MAIEGSLQSVDVQDIVQLLNVNRSTGLLHIETPAMHGVLYYRDGDIVNASVEGMSGEAAAYVLLSQSEGRFHFEIVDHHAARTIQRPIHDLVLEAARRKDTIEKIRATIKHDNIVFLPLVDVRIPSIRKEFNDFEIGLISQLDGQTDVKEIVDRRKESAFEVFYVLYDLEKRGFLKRVDVYKVLTVVELKKLFGRSREVQISKTTADEWVEESMTYANCAVVEIHTRKNTFGQVPMTVKANLSADAIQIPKEIMTQFEVGPGDKVLVKPILSPK